jgi:hypothetical protein
MIGNPLAYENIPGTDQLIVLVVFELTRPIETQTVFAGVAGGVDDQPAGGVPTLVTKFHEPPVGVAGCVSETWKMNHSKYVPPKFVVLPYKPDDSAPGWATIDPIGLLP